MISSRRIEIPCLHRIHDGNPTGYHTISHSIGMSIEINDLKCRLRELNSSGIENGVTITQSLSRSMMDGRMFCN